MKRLYPLTLLVFLILALSAFAVSCDGDDDPKAPETTPTAEATASPGGATSTPEASPSETVVPAEPTATPEPSETPGVGCPIEDVVCNLGESLEVALENGDYGAIIDLMQSREQTCPGGQPQGAGGPFPLCEGAAQGEVRTGYDLARRYSEGSFVDRDGVILYVEGFMNAVTPTATDAHGDGALRLQGVSCAQESGGNCELATVFFTAILEESRRELLIFWVPLPASPEKPINRIWNGAILPDDEPVVFESGGDLFDLGEVYVLEE